MLFSKYPSLFNITTTELEEVTANPIPLSNFSYFDGLETQVTPLNIGNKADFFRRHNYVRSKAGTVPTVEDLNIAIKFSDGKVVTPEHLLQCKDLTSSTKKVLVDMPYPHTQASLNFSPVGGTVSASPTSPAVMGC